MARGYSQVDAAYAVWPPGLAAGLIPSLVYSFYLLTKNGTWGRYRAGGRDALLSCLMAVFWMGAMAIYGTATAKLGSLGTSLGWALFQIFIIMSANLSGVITGEWKTAAARARTLLWAGLGLLAAATVAIAWANNA
jgi:L-rhamnose-H+ transport protein